MDLKFQTVRGKNVRKPQGGGLTHTVQFGAEA